MTPNAFKAVVDIDLLGSFNTAHATMPHLIRARPYPNTTTTGPDAAGRIIFVSATFHYTGLPMQAHVSAAKAGVDSLMGSVALEYGPMGVTSNVIAPGPVEDTEGMSRLAGSDKLGGLEAKLSDEALEVRTRARDLRRNIPSGRWGTASDIANATVYLFSEAGSYVNGHALVVDGASWRRQSGAMLGSEASGPYPDYLLEYDCKSKL